MTERLPERIRREVAERAARRCEYCRRPDGMGFYASHVDHIIPLLHGGSSSLDNLAWACFQCNVLKGANVASYDPKTNLLTPLYNPRTQVWDTHFQIDMASAVISGKTPIGRVTVRLLEFNHIEQIETRQALIETQRW